MPVTTQPPLLATLSTPFSSVPLVTSGGEVSSAEADGGAAVPDGGIDVGIKAFEGGASGGQAVVHVDVHIGCDSHKQDQSIITTTRAQRSSQELRA